MLLKFSLIVCTCGCLLFIRQTAATLIPVKKVSYRTLLAPINTTNITKVTYFHKQSHWSDNEYILLARHTRHSNPDGGASGTTWASESHPEVTSADRSQGGRGSNPRPSDHRMTIAPPRPQLSPKQSAQVCFFFFLEGADAATPQADGG